MERKDCLSLAAALLDGPDAVMTDEEELKLWRKHGPELMKKHALAQDKKDAQRWRTLMAYPKASKRIWNHVLDADDTKLGNSVEEVLDAVASKNGGAA